MRLMRPKHYVKNGLILLPLVFGNQLLNSGKLWQALVALATFSLVASIVYIINDIRDAEKDRLHPEKKHRPLASGKVSPAQAVALAIFLSLATAAIGLAGHLNATSWLLLITYLIVNIAYSFGLKNLPIADIALLASGFVLRVLFGASVFGIEVSHWLYLTILAGAFYMSLGKRRNEIITNGTKSRKVNEAYSLQFLEKNMYVCLTLALVFYALWAAGPERANVLLYASIPFAILISMAYSLSIEKNDSSGDPVDVLFKSRMLRILVPAYVLMMILAVYL